MSQQKNRRGKVSQIIFLKLIVDVRILFVSRQTTKNKKNQFSNFRIINLTNFANNKYFGKKLCKGTCATCATKCDTEAHIASHLFLDLSFSREREESLFKSSLHL